MSITKSFRVNGEKIELNSSEASILSLGDSRDSGADLEIADSSDNVLVRFSNGHIHTKSFDSSKIQTAANPSDVLKQLPFYDLWLNKFSGKTLGILGDSISTFKGWLPSDISGYDGATYAYYFPTGNVTSVTDTWWWKLATALGMDPEAQVSNCAWSGSTVSGDSTSTTSAAAGCSDRRISDLTARGFTPDIIICYISCNDWGQNKGVGTWKTDDPIPAEGNIQTLREAYALMLYKLHSKYPDSRVFCCTNLDDKARDRAGGYPPNNTSGISTNSWNSNITEIAETMGCDVINLHDCGINYANISKYVVDAGLHPNAAGHTLMARKILAELFAKY